jgi:hypothetical protein
VLPILTPSARGLTGVGKGRTAWRLRLAALQWAEFQVGACKINTKTDAYNIVARAVGLALHTIKGWPREVANQLGEAVVREGLNLARRIGEHVHHINGKIASGEANERDRRYCIYLEGAYSPQLLKELGQKFKELPRRKRKGGK